jgi:hypothetical protein
METTRGIITISGDLGTRNCIAGCFRNAELEVEVVDYDLHQIAPISESSSLLLTDGGSSLVHRRDFWNLRGQRPGDNCLPTTVLIKGAEGSETGRAATTIFRETERMAEIVKK